MIHHLGQKVIGHIPAHRAHHMFVSGEPAESDFADARIGIAHDLWHAWRIRTAVLFAPLVDMALGMKTIHNIDDVRMRHLSSHFGAMSPVGSVSPEVTSIIMDDHF